MKIVGGIILLRLGLVLGSTVNITLLGDSLIGRPCNDHGLESKILERIQPEEWKSRINLINSGNSGNKIADILARVDDVLSFNNPSAVILFWDSDCSNVDESSMSSEEVTNLRANYSANVQSVTTKILSYPSLSKNCFAIAGPEVLGEGITYNPFEPSRFRGKEDMLNDYRAMTKNITESFLLSYIDVRQAFLDDNEEQQWDFYKGLDTEDGEHPSDRGSTIEATLFANQINIWIADGKFD